MESDVIKTRFEISKELEMVAFKSLMLKSPPQNRSRKFCTFLSKGSKKRWIQKKCKILPAPTETKKDIAPKTQFEAFQGAMKLLFITGQLLGLNPVRGILDTDVGNVRFTICYWRFVQSTLIGIAQAIGIALSLYRLLQGITIEALSYFAFFATTCFTTILFIQIGSKWPKLMKEISKSGLDEYIDPRIQHKCYIASVTIISAAIIEHLLSLLHKILHVFDCHKDVKFYDEFLRDQFPWLFDLNVPRSIPLGIILQTLNVISTINWNYSDLFIVCMSLYLASILEKLNKKIISACDKPYLSSSYWRALREDYTRATRLVHYFDDVISGIILISFASNLFFICLQLFNILVRGVKEKSLEHICAYRDNGLIWGYEYTVYLLFSTIYLVARSLTISLVAARVNTASMVPAPALYSVPSTAFCEEVSRFISQVHGDKIALSGLQFFYVTRELVLSVAATIVTYELVLLQFSAAEISANNK